MDGSEKRLYVVTGTTPNKPSEKRTCEQEQQAEQPIQQRPARRTLAFQEKESPSQKVHALITIKVGFENNLK